MKLVIVSGLSGSGKSVALHTLEDLDYYCIDNLPVSLLEAFATQLAEATDPRQELAAAGIDARTHPSGLQRFPDILRHLREQHIDCEILFLHADEDTLLKRFSETRRKHPLSRRGVSLADAVRLERQLLDPIAANADVYIDTSRTNIHQLRDLIRQRVANKDSQTLSLLFESFGYKHGVPVDADFVFDVRCLPNPHWDPQLRPYTGQDRPVAEYLENDPMVGEMLADLIRFLEAWIPRFQADNRSYLTVALGCTGGQHRSVYLTERLAAHFRDRHENVVTRHRELS
jgi:RNase adapter protein RapZ